MLSVAGVLRSQDGNEKQITKGGSHFRYSLSTTVPSHRLSRCRVNVHTRVCTVSVSNENFQKGSVESTHKVPTSHYHTKHCHAAVVSLGGLTHR